MTTLRAAPLASPHAMVEFSLDEEHGDVDLVLTHVDRNAEFSAFMRDAHASLHRTAYLLCGDAHWADELTQQAFERTYRAWSRARKGDPLAYARKGLAYRHAFFARLCPATPEAAEQHLLAREFVSSQDSAAREEAAREAEERLREEEERVREAERAAEEARADAERRRQREEVGTGS